MRVPVWVVDTNVLVSAASTAGGTCDLIFRAAVDGRIRLSWSTQILAEYRVVLSRPKFQFSPEVVTSFLKIFESMDQVTPQPLGVRLPDPADSIFLATAMATPDQILITGNSAHFPVDLCIPVRIFTPSQARELLASC